MIPRLTLLPLFFTLILISCTEQAPETGPCVPITWSAPGLEPWTACHTDPEAALPEALERMKESVSCHAESMKLPELSTGGRVHIDEECRAHLLSTTASGEALLTLGLPLDINHASAIDLEALPGIGPALARRIVESRSADGPYPSTEAMSRVKGIGPKTVEKLSGLVTTSSSR